MLDMGSFFKGAVLVLTLLGVVGCASGRKAAFVENEGITTLVAAGSLDDILPQNIADDTVKITEVVEVEDVAGSMITMNAVKDEESGEMVAAAVKAADILAQQGASCRVLDMYCVKPIDREAVVRAAQETGHIITIEEHSRLGGLGSMVSQIVGEEAPCPVINLALPDEPAIAGKSQEVFDYYGLNAENLVKEANKLLVRF